MQKDQDFTRNLELMEGFSEEELFNLSKINFKPQEGRFGDFTNEDINDQVELGDLLSQLNKVEYGSVKQLNQELEGVFKEDEVLLEYFFKKINSCREIDQAKGYLEGLYYEQKIRQNQSEKLLKKIDASLSKKLNLKVFQETVSQLSREIKLFKKFAEKRNLRHSGKYKEEVLNSNTPRKSKQGGGRSSSNMKRNPKDLPEDDSVYDWIVDIDYITNVGKTADILGC